MPGLPDMPVPEGFLGVLGPAEATLKLTLESLPEPEPVEATPDSNLRAYLKSLWETHKKAKETSGVEDQMVSNLRAVAGDYEGKLAAELTAVGAPDIFLSVTELKSRHAVSWLLDIFSNEEDQPWGLRPSPVPVLPDSERARIEGEIAGLAEAATQQGQPPSEQDLSRLLEESVRDVEMQVVRRAADRVERCERKILDQMNAGGWPEIFEDFIRDLVVLKAGIVKGPIPRIRPMRVWEETEGGGQMAFQPQTLLTFDRVSPFDAYPAPDAVDFRSDFIERQRLSRASLAALRDDTAYDREAIDRALSEFDSMRGASWLAIDQTRLELEERSSDARTQQNTVEALEFWFSVSGAQLKTFGWMLTPDGDLIDDGRAYDLTALMVGEHVVFFGINDDPLGRKPYSKNGWEPISGSFWYRGLPELLAPVQRIVNQCARALVYNISVGSGPQIEIPDINRLLPDESPSDVFPGRVWQGTNSGNSPQPLIRFNVIDLRAQELLGVLDRFINMADDYSGVPAYAYGDDRGSNSSRTSSGLSMLMTASARGIKRVVLSVDRRVFRELITRIYDWDLIHSVATEFAGDVEVVATGAVAIMVKEQMAERRIAFLAQTANPVDQQLMGFEGRGALLRESAKTLELAGQKVVRDEEELRQLEAEQKKAAEAQAQAATQAEQAKVELEKARLELDRIRIEGDLEIKRMELDLKRQELEIKRADSATRSVAADGKARADAAKAGVPPADDVDNLIEELGLADMPGEGMPNELTENGAGAGAPGGGVMVGSEVPESDGVAGEGAPGGPMPF